VQGKKNTGSGHLRKLVGQATSTPAGRNTLTNVSGGFAVQLFLLVSGVVVARHISAPGTRHSFSDDSEGDGCGVGIDR
jgi:hypothetical protein